MTVPVEEVMWGESQERDIVQLWVEHSSIGRRAHRFVKSLEFDPYDVLVIADKGLPLCALEIKARRIPWGEYGDVLTPLKKHEFALAMRELGLPYLLVTLYADGTLVEVDLSEKPQQTKCFARRDRPGSDPVWHGMWKGKQVRVLRGAS